jgi:uncharacterized protein (TIGR03118 family)
MKALGWRVAVLLAAGCQDQGLPIAPLPVPQELVTRTDLVSDEPGAAATDPTLVNAWGLSFNPMGIGWVSAAGSGISKVYNSAGGHVIPPVVIPNPPGIRGPSSPTGQAYNGDAGAFFGDRFIFVTEQGMIAGWQSGPAALRRIDNSASGAIYKGIALGNVRLYATDFHNGRVDVYDVRYQAVASGFRDPNLPPRFAPFNVQVVHEMVLVSYALQDDAGEDDVQGDGNGLVDLYDASGNLLGRLISGRELNSPWGMALAPSSFAAAPGRLLVGNFGDGYINFYDVDFANHTASFAGMLRDSGTAAPLNIQGLWALKFGPGTGGFAVNQLYFTAGPGDQMHGRFGRLTSKGTVSMPPGGAVSP